MPFGIKKDTGQCSDSKPFVAYNTETGEKKSCFETREAALKYQRALMANTRDLSEYQSAEIYLAGGSTDERDNLIWKDILVEGEWAYRPGAGQKPVPIPLKVTGGHTSDPYNELGMEDIVDAFNDQAFENVTIPLSHSDTADENTGFVRALKKEDRDGKKVLRAGMEFTEKDIEGKVKRGTIAGTSAGIVFDKIRQDSGKTFKQALGHVNITNKPWLNGMNPVGVAASEHFADDEILPLELAEGEPDTIHLSADEVEGLDLASGGAEQRRKWAKSGVAMSDGSFPITHCGNDAYSNGAARKRASSGNAKTSSIMSHIRKREKALGCKSGGSNLAEDTLLEYITTTTTSTATNLPTVNTNFPSKDESPVEGEESKNQHNQGVNMSEENTPVATEEKPETGASKEEEGAQAQSNAQEGISDEARELINAQNEEIEKLRGDLTTVGSSLSEARRDLHQKNVSERVGQLEKMGFAQYPGLLGEIRSVLLADTKGEKVLKLSEQKDDETTEVELSATDIVERVIAAMPYDEDKRLNFSDQLVEMDDHSKPEDKPKSDARAIAESWDMPYPAEKEGE